MQGLLPAPGDIVWIRQQRWRVERAWKDRHVVRLDVASRDRRMTFLSPFDRAIVPPRRRRPIRVRPQQAVARLAQLVARAPDARLPLTAIDARIDLHPHQLAPVLAAARGHCRLLLADEVGLGKTIQAALVIAEVARRERAARVLVIAPATLRDQWAAELTDRFGITPTLADRVTLDALARAGAYGDNPWRRSGVWIVSPDFLKQRHVMDSLPRDPWDLVVIDEAHLVCGDSDRYETCQSVARRARRVVLMTATPHSGDEARFNRLVQLGGHNHGDNQRDDFLAFRRTRASLGMPVYRRIRWHFVSPSSADLRTYAALAAFERTVLSSAGADPTGHAFLLLSVFRKRALSSFTALSRTLSRRLGWLGDRSDDSALDWTQPRLTFDEVTDEAADEERTALTAHTGVDHGKERSWLRRIRQLADEAARRETKISRLTSLVCRTTEPVVIFTEFADSLVAIQRSLHLSRSMAILHGTQDPAERRANLKRFLDGHASVLLATDVASQGLNLQARARWVISLELPWNPARLEQRVGRIDRLGQTRTPHMTLLVSRHPAESDILAHIAKRVLTARRTFSEDSLTTLPSESELAAAILQCATPPPSQAPPRPAITGTISPTVRWRRLELASAHELQRRRSLSRFWRPPVDETGGAVWTRARNRNAIVCSIPFRNARDEVVDRVVVAAHVDPRRPLSEIDFDRLAKAVGWAARKQIHRELRKCELRVRSEATRMVQRERDVAHYIHDEDCPGEAQHGLFDVRDARSFERDRFNVARLTGASAKVIDRWGEESSLRAGDAIVEIFWTTRA